MPRPSPSPLPFPPRPHCLHCTRHAPQANDMYGLNVLVFDVKEGHIAEVVGFRQPLRSEHDHIFKVWVGVCSVGVGMRYGCQCGWV